MLRSSAHHSKHSIPHLRPAESRQPRKHLDKLFHQARLDGLRQRPPKGWIRAIRDALGLTVRQLARRMGKTHSVVVRLEGSEAANTITLASLRAAAEAMDCTLIYAIVPNRSLTETARGRATAIADAWRSPEDVTS